jgi:type III pantothenate kinase
MQHEVTGTSQKVLGNMHELMGADRVADAVAAWSLYGKPGQPIVAMSFGTASTLLAVDGKGNVIGGWIMPGMKALLKAMHDACALLPLLEMENQGTTLGVDTETHMRNGVFVGCIGAAREWLKTASGQVSGTAVSVATGGWSSVLQQHGKIFDHVDPSLTLKGIHLIATAASGKADEAKPAA